MLIIVPAALMAAVTVSVPPRERRIEVASCNGDGDGGAFAGDGSEGEVAEGSRTPLLRPAFGFYFYGIAVFPSAAARRLGSLLGDLRIAPHVLGPALPFAVPFALLVASITASAAEACEVLPFVVGVVFIVYAVLVAVWWPFLGVWHNVSEALAAATVGSLAIVLGVALLRVEEADAGGDRGWLEGGAFFLFYGGDGGVDFDHYASTVNAAALAMAAISNCRFPFVVARALGVGVPRVGRWERCAPAAHGGGGSGPNLLLPLPPLCSLDDRTAKATNENDERPAKRYSGGGSQQKTTSAEGHSGRLTEDSSARAAHYHEHEPERGYGEEVEEDERAGPVINDSFGVVIEEEGGDEGTYRRSAASSYTSDNPSSAAEVDGGKDGDAASALEQRYFEGCPLPTVPRAAADGGSDSGDSWVE